jgi:hypothetical protein
MGFVPGGRPPKLAVFSLRCLYSGMVDSVFFVIPVQYGVGK